MIHRILCLGPILAVPLLTWRPHPSLLLRRPASSFQAVAAIAVVCPHLLRGRCSVSVTRGQDYPAKEESWGAYDLVNILSLLYMEEGDADVSQTGALYSKALPIFAVAERSLSKFPFLDLPTTAERIAAAGPFAEPVLAAFSNAAVKLSPHA